MIKLKFVLLAATVHLFISSNAHAYEWNPPGQNPYTGSISTAVLSYKDIPYTCRLALLTKIKFHLPDDRVYIWKDSITSVARSTRTVYDPNIWGMHFGASSRIDANITRNTWTEHQSEIASVYGACGYQIIIPDVCNNVARNTLVYRATRSDVPEPASWALGLIAIAAAIMASRSSRNV